MTGVKNNSSTRPKKVLGQIWKKMTLKWVAFVNHGYDFCTMYKSFIVFNSIPFDFFWKSDSKGGRYSLLLWKCNNNDKKSLAFCRLIWVKGSIALKMIMIMILLKSMDKMLATFYLHQYMSTTTAFLMLFYNNAH